MIRDDTVAAVIDEIRAVDWEAWSIPLPNRLFAYEPGSVVPAFERLADARAESEAQVAYTALSFAIAHSHSGTPYTVMSVATPLLARLVPLLASGAAAGMDMVTDCALWSVGEPPFAGPDGQVHDLARDTLEALRALEPLARRWLQQSGDEHRRWAATSLLEALADLA